MVASYTTIDAIYEAIRRHVSDEQMERIIYDLLQVQGNKSFRDTVRRLAVRDAAHRATQPLKGDA